MRAIDFLQQKKIVNYVSSNLEWYVEYCQKIIELYNHIKILQKNLLLDQPDIKSIHFKDVYEDLKYFFNKHDEADVNLFAINSPYHEMEDILFHKYQSPDQEELVKKRLAIHKSLSSDEFDVLWHTEMLANFLEENIQENKKFVGNYLMDFEIFLINYNLFYKLENLIK